MSTLPQHITDPAIAEAYRQAAERNLIPALNPAIFFGYFAVCADGQGHGGNTTFPGLDWGQSAEALLWLGRTAEVLASWDYVAGFQRPDGALPLAILPDHAGKTITIEGYPMTLESDGAVFVHWVPGKPLWTLANVTFLQLAEAIFSHQQDLDWLRRQETRLVRAADWLIGQIAADGLVHGAGFYVERPTRLGFDGVNQCCTAAALQKAAGLCRQLGNQPAAARCDAAAGRITAAFRARFWAGDHCVEYIHPRRGPISHHGLTDVDWAAVATGVASDEQVRVLWPQLRDNDEFLYRGMPTGISTRPESYEDWEMQEIDRHDLAAMGRVWFLECAARARQGDRDGILRSLRRVAAIGRANGWSWWERYYSEKTGELCPAHMEWYCEYPANLIRIVHRFL